MNKMIKVCLWTLALIPLIADNSLFTPTNSVFFMRTFLFLISVLFLIGFLFSQNFRSEVIRKVNLFIKNPIVISIGVFLLVFIISTIFSIAKYNAFWGTTERAEGLVGLIYFFSFFIFSLFIFEKRDWLWFFKLSLFVSLILLIKEFSQFFGGAVRPDSFIGNPTFLAGYLLFSIFCSIIIFSEAKDKFFRYFSVLIFILSILGIFISGTRSTLVGLAFGFIVVLIYSLIKGKSISFWNFNLRKASIIILCFVFVFGVIFMATRSSGVWQKVPGLSRVAVISEENKTTQTRLLMAELSLESMNPKVEGLKKFLIGWGPENFSLAYAKYFNPKQFAYEVGWFDRSHNKLLDALVMTGILGLLAYLSIWFFFFKSIFKRKDFSLLNIGLLLFGVSLLVHLLFVFDQITTSIPFFVVLAFFICLSQEPFLRMEKNNNKIKETEIIEKVYFGVFLSILVLFLTFVYFKNDLPSFIQIKEYASLREKSEVNNLLNKIDEVFEPFTVAQMKIRYDFLSFLSQNYDSKNESIVKLSNIAFERAEEYSQKMPLDLQFSNLLGFSYLNQGKETKDLEYLKKGEEIFKRILVLAPNKLDFNYGLALSWLYEKRYEDSFSKFEQIFNSNPQYFSQKVKGPEGIYTLFIKHFYDVKDKANFIKTANRLKENNYVSSKDLDNIIDFINKTGVWPSINFKS